MRTTPSFVNEITTHPCRTRQTLTGGGSQLTTEATAASGAAVHASGLFDAHANAAKLQKHSTASTNSAQCQLALAELGLRSARNARCVALFFSLSSTGEEHLLIHTFCTTFDRPIGGYTIRAATAAPARFVADDAAFAQQAAVPVALQSYEFRTNIYGTRTAPWAIIHANYKDTRAPWFSSFSYKIGPAAPVLAVNLPDILLGQPGTSEALFTVYNIGNASGRPAFHPQGPDLTTDNRVAENHRWR